MNSIRTRILNRLRRDEGVALIAGIIILFILLGIGTAMIATATGEQKSGYNQQTGESAYALAEAALNAQIYELSLQWPTASDAPSGSVTNYPSSCNASSSSSSYCPSAGDLSSYSVGSQICPAGTGGDAWRSSSTVTNGWTTYVRDAGSGSNQTLFTSTGVGGEQTASAYDATGNGFLWVRAAATVNCHTAVVISRVSEQVVDLSFPNDVLNANGYSVSNSGTKTVLNTQGPSSSQGTVSVRCSGLSSPTTDGSGTCTSFDSSKSQVSPGPTYASPSASSPTLSTAQLNQVISLATAKHTYFGPGVCNFTMDQLAGNPVYIDGSGCGGTINISGNQTANSYTSPGFLVVDDAALSFTGSGTYFGVIYDVNKMNSSGAVVTLGGTVTVVGGIDVDGAGTVSLGSSGNGIVINGVTYSGDLIYASGAFNTLQSFGGAAGTPNTFRQLPLTQ